MVSVVCLRDTCYFEWKILEPSRNTSVKSRDFSVYGVKWYLNFYYETTSGETWATWLRVVLSRREKPKVMPRTFKITTYVEDKQGRLETFDRVPKTLSKVTETQEIWRISEDTLLYRMENFVVKNIFTFVFVFEVVPQFRSDFTEKKEQGKLKEDRVAAGDAICLEKLSEDMLKLCKSSENSDVVLKCGGKSFPAHRIVLSSRSEVLASMFKAPMFESKQGVVEIVDVDPTVLDLFLRYVYSGRISAQATDTATALYQCAHKYAVHPLVRKCASFLMKNLTEDTVCDVLLLAETFEDGQLMDDAISFLIGRDRFLRSSGFKSFTEQHQTIGYKVYLKIYEGNSPSH